MARSEYNTIVCFVISLKCVLPIWNSLQRVWSREVSD